MEGLRTVSVAVPSRVRVFNHFLQFGNWMGGDGAGTEWKGGGDGKRRGLGQEGHGGGREGAEEK